ncbi:hypothetical protein SLS60_003246 [Paraconiothyrium brasiliense]|uniref:Uncharacterized protein n=1 Tax=Paraconiothyrium brasiliense TaxID=300254 RepID=A0ABR3RV60_9PLEO
MATASVDSKTLIYKRNTEQSPFLRLPGELRNKVYADVLAGMDYRVENYNGLCGEVSWKQAKYHSANRDSYKGNKHRLSLVPRFTLTPPG